MPKLTFVRTRTIPWNGWSGRGKRCVREKIITRHVRIKQNLWEAFKLCSQAAEAGDTTGMLLLAHYYLLIPSTEENVRKSLEWAEKAQAAGGNAGVLLEEARKRLGEFRKEEKKKKGLFGRKR